MTRLIRYVLVAAVVLLPCCAAKSCGYEGGHRGGTLSRHDRIQRKHPHRKMGSGPREDGPGGSGSGEPPAGNPREHG